MTRSSLAYSYFQAKQIDRALSLNAEALAIAERAQDFTALGRAHNMQGILRDEAGDREGERREMQAAIDAARRAGAKSDEALYLANLSDFYLKSGQYKTALMLAEQALPLTRELRDTSGETVALANIGLAHISLKDFDAGKRFVNEAIAIDERRGALGGVAMAYSELGVYLEKAGDFAGAAQAFHKHRQLNDEILQRDQQKAIVEMQERYDAERRTRDIALLNRENELKGEQLRQRDLQQRLWWLLAATFVLSLGVVVMLYRKVRRSNAALASTNQLLLVQSERDPLTGLANRRHFQAAVKQLADDLGPQFRFDPQMSFEPATMTFRHVFQVVGIDFKIEVFHLSDDPHDQERFRRRKQLTLLGHNVTFPTPEDVIITKVRWATQMRRSKDLDDARNVIAVQGNTIDWEYVYSCYSLSSIELLFLFSTSTEFVFLPNK